MPLFTIILVSILKIVLSEKVKKLKLTNQIHFLGYRTDIPKLLKISDLAISSAKQEGLPVNIMEAMYVGLPIVATDCRGNRDLVEDGVNGYLVDLEDSENFRDKIEGLSKTSELYFKLKKESEKHIQKYLLQQILPQMKIIYNKN